MLVFTEFTEAPEPAVRERSYPAGKAVEKDQTLTFGAMRLVPGRAFKLWDTPWRAGASVMKQWQTFGPRRILVESVRYRQAEQDLLKLPNPEEAATNKTARVASPARWFAEGTAPPMPKWTGETSGPMKLMAALAPRDGFVLDWELVEFVGWQEFWCGWTYLVEGEVHVSEAVFEPGAVIKYGWGSSLWVDLFT